MDLTKLALPIVGALMALCGFLMAIFEFATLIKSFDALAEGPGISTTIWAGLALMLAGFGVLAVGLSRLRRRG